jgi:hypothetical protein
MVGGLMLPSTAAFVVGMLALGLAAPEARLQSPTAAMVRMSERLRDSQSHHQ